MKTNYPIFILSKGRWDNCKTAELFIQYDIPFYLVVEPSEWERYAAVYTEESILTLPTDNSGVSYTRNFIKRLASRTGYLYHWQVDDNIQRFSRRYDGKNHKVNPLDSFLAIEHEVHKYENIGMAGFMHDAFAFAQTKEILFNKMIYCCMLIKSGLKSTFKKGTAEDIDFSVQVLMEDNFYYTTLLFTKFLIKKPQMGSQKGGNRIEYDNGGRKKRNLQLAKDYPKWFFEYEKNNVSKIKPSRIWRSFKQVPLTKKQKQPKTLFT